MALKECLENLALSSEPTADAHILQKFCSRFETVVQNTLWIDFFSTIYKTNLIIEAQEATLDIVAKNIQSLQSTLKKLTWNKILVDSKMNAAAKHQENVFLTILEGLCTKFPFLWNFQNMENNHITKAATHLQAMYNNDISLDLSVEMDFLKEHY